MSENKYALGIGHKGDVFFILENMKILKVFFNKEDCITELEWRIENA